LARAALNPDFLTCFVASWSQVLLRIGDIG
jgi:hypothetical protein